MLIEPEVLASFFLNLFSTVKKRILTHQKHACFYYNMINKITWRVFKVKMKKMNKSTIYLYFWAYLLTQSAMLRLWTRSVDWRTLSTSLPSSTSARRWSTVWNKVNGSVDSEHFSAVRGTHPIRSGPKVHTWSNTNINYHNLKKNNVNCSSEN